MWLTAGPTRRLRADAEDRVTERGGERRREVYVGPNDGGVQQVLADNLVGLLYVRNYGNAEELAQLRRLRDHLSRFGAPVRIFAVTTEPNHEIQCAHTRRTWEAVWLRRCSGHAHRALTP